MGFYSVTFTSINEKGDRQAHFVMRRTWLDKLLLRQAREHTFVQRQPGSTIWHEKGTGRRASPSWEMECCNASEWARQEATNRGTHWPAGA